MGHTEKWKQLPDVCKEPNKRTRGKRGRLPKNKKLRKLASVDSSSDASPLKKVVFDLTAFSSDDDEELREQTPPPSSFSDDDDDESEESEGKK